MHSSNVNKCLQTERQTLSQQFVRVPHSSKTEESNVFDTDTDLKNVPHLYTDLLTDN